MFYREAGDFKTTYADDNQTFPIAFDRYRYYFVLFVGLAIVPFVINDYWANAILLPFLIYAIAAIGLNILTGYCGQVSLGTGGFMAVGAYTSYKLMTAFPWMDMVTDHAPVGRHDGHRGRNVRPAVPAHQGLLPGRGDACGAVLPCLGLQQGAVVLQLLGLGPDQRAGTLPVRSGGDRAERGTLGQLPVLLRPSLRTGLDGAKPDARVNRAAVDGDPRHGHRGRDHRGEPAEGQTERLCRVVFLSSASPDRCSSRSTSARSRLARPSGSRNRSSCSS
jgi:hypothetical protein